MFYAQPACAAPAVWRIVRGMAALRVGRMAALHPRAVLAMRAGPTAALHPRVACNVAGRWPPPSHRADVAAAAAASPASSHVEALPASQSTPPLPTSDESEELLRIRHSCAHIMAMAVQRLHKGAQVTIGPWTERGFFYDFDMPQPLTERDLPKIRKEMQRILKKNLPFVREEVSAAEARRRIQARRRHAAAHLARASADVRRTHMTRLWLSAMVPALCRMLASYTSSRFWTRF